MRSYASKPDISVSPKIVTLAKILQTGKALP